MTAQEFLLAGVPVGAQQLKQLVIALRLSLMMKMNGSLTKIVLVTTVAIGAGRLTRLVVRK
jgi:hypothetical protein